MEEEKKEFNYIIKPVCMGVLKSVAFPESFGMSKQISSVIEPLRTHSVLLQ